MTEKASFYKKHINAWKEIHDFQLDRWIYRGQRDSTRKLKTTLERACNNYAVPLQAARDIEDTLLREFKRKFHHYSHYIPYKEDNLEWFSLMQHYGAPTRLLDFTYSVYVAAYFALEEALEPKEARKDYAIWAINGKWAINESANFFEKDTREFKFLKEPIEDERGKAKAFESLFRRDVPIAFVCPQNPFRLNERLTIQKGVFMCPGNVTLPFEENLRFLPGWKEKQNVVKIIIPNELRRDALNWLYDANNTRATLFPGLDGFAKSLNVSLPKKWNY